MNDKGSQLLLTVIAACISLLLLLITTTYGAVVVVGGDYTDIGTIVFVSPKPGDAADANGKALLNTLNGITTADSDNPYLIKLGPGTYDLGSTGLQMKEYVSIEGSGEKATKITAAASTAWIPSLATVMGANNTELRSLAVENTGTGAYTVAVLNTSASPSLFHVTATASGGSDTSIGVFNVYSSSPTMTHVTVTATGGTTRYNHGVYNQSSSSPTMKNVTITASWGSYACYGVSNLGSSPVMTDVTTTATWGPSSYGVYNFGYSSPTLTNVTATASGVNSYGVYNAGSGSTVKINHSVIRGETNTIYNGLGVTTGVGDTQLDGGEVGGTGTATLTCAVVYDENYTYYASTCP